MISCRAVTSCSVLGGGCWWHLSPRKVTLSPTLTVNVKIAAKHCPASPNFCLQEDDIFIIGRVSHPQPPPQVTPLSNKHF